MSKIVNFLLRYITGQFISSTFSSFTCILGETHTQKSNFLLVGPLRWVGGGGGGKPLALKEKMGGKKKKKKNTGGKGGSRWEWGGEGGKPLNL